MTGSADNDRNTPRGPSATELADRARLACTCEVTCSTHAAAVAAATDPGLVPPHVVTTGLRVIDFGDGTAAVACREDPTGNTLREIYYSAERGSA